MENLEGVERIDETATWDSLGEFLSMEAEVRDQNHSILPMSEETISSEFMAIQNSVGIKEFQK
ncbi:uncharacterized protein N7484_001069 [Penicillium longicatenatum]|uniref:uncharacterized protein n=1 Tax=Penicillium longicatenatum TaxID=1561947 RepID=UPI002547D9E1|nr:uncharacterized protein N7484_001069 [Penicillium longicatenatum]KAJ5657420.1 hypothetical protein N7484_001069 [Penicillium longicatenatum]KAJ5663104.1 hypothetical protein N7507_003835 [Penicillium longicatenatum]